MAAITLRSVGTVYFRNGDKAELIGISWPEPKGYVKEPGIVHFWQRCAWEYRECVESLRHVDQIVGVDGTVVKVTAENG